MLTQVSKQPGMYLHDKRVDDCAKQVSKYMLAAINTHLYKLPSLCKSAALLHARAMRELNISTECRECPRFLSSPSPCTR